MIKGQNIKLGFEPITLLMKKLGKSQNNPPKIGTTTHKIGGGK